MHTLNIEAASKHAVDFASNFGPLSGGGTGTPLSLNTPDILNSLISITSNPFFGQSASTSGQASQSESSDQNGGNTEEDKKVFATLEVPQGSGPGPNSRPIPSIVIAPPPPSTVQSLRSQFIKDSLKLTIQTKRKSSGKEELDLQAELEVKVRKGEEVVEPVSYFKSISNSHETANKLTPEDEERRKRRRERNKIAATKCRNKKKEKTGLLVQESHTLESNNVTLKSEISKLEEQRQRLTEILAAHVPVCTMKSGHAHAVRLVSSSESRSPYSREYNLAPTPGNPAIYYHIQQPTRHHLSAQRS